MGCPRMLTAVALTGVVCLAAGLQKEFTPQQRRWWAFQKVAKPVVPAVKHQSWIHNNIDAFVLAKLDEKGLHPAPPADKVTLIRRATLDLTGLLPTPEEVQAFAGDNSPDAFAKVVDRLLASPRYGERWARHWLDLARYADSEGFKSDETRPNIWRYRDYVIDAFNQDKPYDRFIKEQIAGDELYPNDPSALVATGFNRHFPDESNARNLMQRRQEILNDIRAEMAKLAEPAMKAMYKDSFDKFPDEIRDAVNTAPDKRTPIQWQMYYKAKSQIEHSIEDAAKKLKGDAKKRFGELQAELAKSDGIKPPALPVAQSMIDNGKDSPQTHVLAVGVYDAYKEEVQPGFLSILDPMDAKITPPEGLPSSGRRSALANWLADPANPLTARVMANRIWHYHFGQGLVGTPSDFGVMGERPANKELLDYLAASFVEGGWSIKKMHRAIMLSNTYQQSTKYDAAAAKVDPQDKLLWRYNRHRLEGESIRDSMLEVSGHLNLKMGGPGVFPPLPPGVVTRGGWKKESDPSEAERRSVYVFVRRNTRYPMFEVFDMPDTHESCARRNTTITAPQALELMNNDLVAEWSRAMAARVMNGSGLTPEGELDRPWKLAYSRLPSAEERESALKFVERQM